MYIYVYICVDVYVVMYMCTVQTTREAMETHLYFHVSLYTHPCTPTLVHPPLNTPIHTQPQPPQASRLQKSLDMQGLGVYWDVVDHVVDQSNLGQTPLPVSIAATTTHTIDPPPPPPTPFNTPPPPTTTSHTTPTPPSHDFLLRPTAAGVLLSSQKEVAVERGSVLVTHLRCTVACGPVGVCATQKQLEDVPLLINSVLLWQLRSQYAVHKPSWLVWGNVVEGRVSRQEYWRYG